MQLDAFSPAYRLVSLTFAMRTLLASWIGFALAASALATPMLDQANVITQSSGGVSIRAGNSPGQVFTVGAGGLLSQIDVLMRRDAASIGTLSLEVWPVSTVGPAGGAPLFSVPIDSAIVPVGTPNYVSVNVQSGGLSVAPGEKYAITLSGSATSGNPSASWWGGTPHYAGGGKYDYDGSWYTAGANYDYGFKTWVDPDAAGGFEELVLTPVLDSEMKVYPNGFSIALLNGDSILIDRVDSNGADSRGMFEYDASGLPEGAAVLSGEFIYDMTQMTSSSSSFPGVELYGFHGNGPSNSLFDLPLGSSGPITEFKRTPVSIDGPALSSLVNGTGTVGVMAYQASNQQLSIASSELAARFPASYVPPTLTIRYATESTPEPWPTALGDYNRDARVDAADYTVWRDASQRPGDLRADGDDDGDVDQQDYNLWRNNYGTGPNSGVTNGGFGTGTLSSWDVQTDPNTNVSFGFPRVESFDVDGDGAASSAMRLRLGRQNTNAFGGRVVIEQELLLAGGDYELAADVASQSLETTGNTAPGNFELIFDGVVVDQVLLNGTVIDPSQVIRDSLLAMLTDIEPGYHTLGIAISRGGTNTRAIYQFIDDIRLTPLGSAVTVPEPGSLSLLVGLVSLHSVGFRPRLRRFCGPAC
jgi:hypothetical protein